MSEIKVLRTQLALTTEVVEASLADITHDESVQSVMPAVNHMNWILGHLVQVNSGILELLGRPADPPSAALGHYVAGVRPVDDGDAWALSDLREAFLRQTELIDQALSDAPPELLAAPPPPGFEGEMRDFLYFISFHQGYHVGQLGMLRRAMGYDRAFG